MNISCQDFSDFNNFLRHSDYSKIFILTDENTHQYCLPTLLANLETDKAIEIFEIEPGEEMKNVQTANHLWEILTEMSADRQSLLINLGGGVVTDLGGFVASTYKRGIDFINIPTTLLAMCDASIGGKTGIDLMNYKNMIGTFAFAREIFVYPEFLETLPLRELKSGFAEMLKHGLIADKKHWEELTAIKNLNPEGLQPYIMTSAQIKNEIVSKDFDEKNIRKTLNFGHTVGHAIESLCLSSGKSILHGEAVAIGMITETHLAYLEKLIPKSDCNYIIENISRYFDYIDITDFKDEDIFVFLLNDKKNTDSKINFSLISDIGSCVFDYQSSTQNIKKSLDHYRKISGF